MDRPCILVVAALQEELDAIWHPGAGFTWSAPPEEFESIWFRRSSHAGYDLISACAGEMGQVATAMLVSKLSLRFRPVLVVMIGICGGRKDLKFAIGDIVFSSKGAQYHIGRQSKRSPSASGGLRQELYATVDVRMELVDLIKRELSEDAFLCELGESSWEANPSPGSTPSSRTGTFVSADFVLKDAEKFQSTVERDRTVVAVDMESYAALRAAMSCEVEFGAIVIKAISDHGDAGKEKRGRGFAKSMSALVASRFINAFTEFHRQLPRPADSGPKTVIPVFGVKPTSILVLAGTDEGLEALKASYRGKFRQSDKKLPFSVNMFETEVDGVTVYAARYPKRMVDSTIFCVAAILSVRPALIVATGSCGGVRRKRDKNDIAIGDLVVANRAFHFQFGGLKDGEFEPEIRAIDVNDYIRGFLLAISAAKFGTIIEGLSGVKPRKLDEMKPRFAVTFAPIATSDLFVDGEDIEEKALAAERKVVAFDMEAYALSRTACYLTVPFGVLVIRAVADIVGEEEDVAVREFCNRLSAGFAMSVLRDELIPSMARLRALPG